MTSSPFRKLILAFFVMILLVVVTSPLATIWLIKEQANRIVEDDLRGLTTSSLASMNVSEGFLHTANAVSDANPGNLPEIIVNLNESIRQVDAQYESHRQTLQTKEELEQFETLIERRMDYRKIRQAIFKLLEEGRRPEARTLFENECEPKYEAYAKALGKVVEGNVAKARASGRKIISLCNWLLLIQVVLLGFFFIYGFFVPLTAIMERMTRKPVVFEE